MTAPRQWTGWVPAEPGDVRARLGGLADPDGDRFSVSTRSALAWSATLLGRLESAGGGTVIDIDIEVPTATELAAWLGIDAAQHVVEGEVPWLLRQLTDKIGVVATGYAADVRAGRIADATLPGAESGAPRSLRVAITPDAARFHVGETVVTVSTAGLSVGERDLAWDELLGAEAQAELVVRLRSGEQLTVRADAHRPGDVTWLARYVNARIIRWGAHDRPDDAALHALLDVARRS